MRQSETPPPLGIAASALAQQCSQQDTNPKGDDCTRHRVLSDDRMSNVHAALALVAELIGCPVGSESQMFGGFRNLITSPLILSRYATRLDSGIIAARVGTGGIGNIAPQSITGSPCHPAGLGDAANAGRAGTRG
jgi:hypothetical protein